ncbi:Retrovirus-related Pol polyprotein from transposon RE1 [Vitis vinifera]|uniref:Retrovirus-related Pol polyprotein from transposon RE1 n=1 Tax=Vitis vinifera TaxID=29760 RepID=A0A438F895_VITVI|nr:Retrovirus-related Pol polyprotein from transposon RE1 [Vitis vinifera]
MGVLSMAYTSNQLLGSVSLASQMPVGPVVSMVEGPPVASVFFFVLTLSHGIQVNKRLLQGPACLNTKHWITRQHRRPLVTSLTKRATSVQCFMSCNPSYSAHASMAAVNQTTGEVLHSDPSAEARRGNPTTTGRILRMVISPLSQLITMRLEDDNFLMWKYQIENVVRGYGLEGFLFGTEQVPPKMVVGCSLAFEVWNTISQNFNSQSSAKVKPQVVGCSSAFEVWNTIPRISILNLCKGMYYKSQMQMLKNDGLTMRDYLTKMKNYCDLLAIAGHKISDTDHILAIMQGLGDEYESVIVVISSKKSSPSLQYVTSTLIAHEGRIAHKISSNDLSVNYTSQYSNRGSSSSWNSNGYPSSGFRNRNQFGGNQVTRGSFVHNRGRGRGRAQGEIKPQCQLCNKFGHTVHRCFYRYDPNFHGNMPANGPTPGVLGSGARNGASGSISSAGNVNLTEYDAQED